MDQLATDLQTSPRAFLDLLALIGIPLFLVLSAKFSFRVYRNELRPNDTTKKPTRASELVDQYHVKPRWLKTWGSRFLLKDTNAASLMQVTCLTDFKMIRDLLEDRGMIFLGLGFAKGWWTTPPQLPVDDVLYEVSRRVYGNLRIFYGLIPTLTKFKYWWQGRHRGVQPQRSTRDRAASDHYNLSSNILWDSILDPETKTYTCGIFSGESLDLGKAQLAKVDYYIDKVMGLASMTDDERRNYSVLDIGAGWGSIVNRLAAKYPTVKVSALTHSSIQAKEYHPSVEAIIADMIDHDYAENSYNCVVMIEVEHVGKNNYPILMKKIRKSLKESGIYVMQSLNTPKTYPFFLDEFIDKFIFPGGYLPSVALLSNAAETAGLKLISTNEWDTIHYEITFENWRRRFASNYEDIQEGIGVEAARAFRVYLAFTQFTLEARGFAPHTMIFNKRGQPGSSVLYPKGVPHVPPVGVSSEVLAQWLSSKRNLV